MVNNILKLRIFENFSIRLGGTASGSCASGFGVCCLCKLNQIVLKSWQSYLAWISELALIIIQLIMRSMMKYVKLQEMAEYRTTLVFRQLTLVRSLDVQKSDDWTMSELQKFETEQGQYIRAIRIDCVGINCTNFCLKIECLKVRILA